MRNYPDMNDKHDIEELQNLKAEAWMVECLLRNPNYTSWGNYEDYMSKKGNWDGALEFDNVDDGLFELDDLNELVNFYFEVKRESKECERCNQSGYNKETKQISDDWYDFNHTGRRWQNKIAQDEVDALWENNRLRVDFNEKPTAEQVNEWSKKGFGHDSINHWICVETRAKRLGVWGMCEHCGGKGYVYTEPKAKLSLQLWYLHPRKGCSRGVYIKNVEKNDLPKVYNFLQEAAKRNSDRFSKIQNL